MSKSRIVMSSIAALSLASLSACVTDPNTGEQKVSRTAIGGVAGGAAGAILGGLIGGKTGRIIGAGIGGVGGAAVGATYDRQIKELRENTAGSGVDVSEVDGGEAILVNLPDGVTFATGSATINSQFRNTLDQVANTLVQYPDSLIDVYGYTDSTGSEAFNQRLSEQRAQAVLRATCLRIAALPLGHACAAKASAKIRAISSAITPPNLAVRKIAVSKSRLFRLVRRRCASCTAVTHPPVKRVARRGRAARFGLFFCFCEVVFSRG